MRYRRKKVYVRYLISWWVLVILAIPEKLYAFPDGVSGFPTGCQMPFLGATPEYCDQLRPSVCLFVRALKRKTAWAINTERGTCELAKSSLITALLLTATGFVNGKEQFSTPHRIDTPQPITKKFVTGDYVGDPYGYANCQMRCISVRGGFWTHGWNITKIILIYAVFGTYLQVRRIFKRDGSNDAESRKDVHFWKLFTLLPITGSKPPKPSISGVNRRFKTKLAKSKNAHII